MDRLRTIGVKSETKRKLDKFKLCPTESYDHLLNRLVSNILITKEKEGENLI